MSQQQQQPSSSVSKTSSSYVLYVNDEYQPIPLLQCYHSIASKSLCSTGSGGNDSYYPNTILKQIDSYYCSNCLQYYDKIQSINTPYYGTCTTCYTCPFCITSIVCIQYNEIIDNNTNTNNDNDKQPTSMILKHFHCYYQCNNCDYSSKLHSNISIQLSLQISKSDHNPNNNNIDSSLSSSSTTSNSNNNNTIFTKWETLQKSAIEQLNNMIRQQYYMSVTETMNQTNNNNNDIDTTNTNNTASKLTLQYYYYLLNEWKLYYSTTTTQQQQQQYKSSSSKSLLLNTTTKTNLQQPTIKPSTNIITTSNTKHKWSMEELEMKLKSIQQQQQQQQTKINVSSNHNILSNQEDDDKSLLKNKNTKYNHNSIRRISIHDILRQQQQEQQQKEQQEDNNTKNKYENISLLSYLIQCMLYQTTTPSINDTIVWYPIPLSFHIRYTYRSKKDVIVYHRPGIVLKSKLNPLDGDSNGNTTLLLLNNNNELQQLQVHNIGQWFRKDSSAIYTIPNIQIIHHTIITNSTTATTTTTKIMKHSFVIQVSNPTLNNIRIRLNQSKYQGEIDYWNEKYDDTNTKTIVSTDRTSSSCNDTNTTTNTTTFNHHCRHVLFDTIESIGTNELSLLLNIPLKNTSSTIELLSMDDTFLVDDNTTLHNSNRIPDMIQHWDSTKQVSNDMTFTTNDNNTLRFITQNRSMAWYELIMNIPQNHDDNNDNQISTSYGIPIALEIFDTIHQQTQPDVSTNDTNKSSSNERNEKDDVVDVYDVVLVWTE